MKINSEKIKILTIVPWNFSGPGGTERSIETTLKNLNKKKFDNYLIKVNVENKNKKNIPEKSRIINNIQQYCIKSRRDIKSIRKIIREVNPSIIFSNTVFINTASLIAKWLAFSKAKFISCIRGIHPRKFIGKVIYFDSFFSDKVVVISKGLEKELIQQFKINPKKIQTIYNPIINFSKINQKLKEPLLKKEKIWLHNKLTIIGVGRLSKEKGFNYLIRAVEILIKKYKKDINLLLVGDGNQKQELIKLAENLRIKNNIFFLGWQENIFKFLEKSDIFVLSSLREGLPRVLIEAMACGIPVVSTNCKFGPPEILKNGKYGVLVRTNDAKDLARGILKLLNNPTLRKKYSKLGKERAKKFSIDKAVKKYEKLFKEVCNIIGENL